MVPIDLYSKTKSIAGKKKFHLIFHLQCDCSAKEDANVKAKVLVKIKYIKN